MKKTIHELLQEKRIEQQLSIQRLSRESGVSASHISRIESCKRKPSPQTLEKLSIPLKVDYITLLDFANLIQNPSTKDGLDIENLLLNEKCMFRGKELTNDTKNILLNILKEQK